MSDEATVEDGRRAAWKLRNSSDAEMIGALMLRFEGMDLISAKCLVIETRLKQGARP